MINYSQPSIGEITGIIDYDDNSREIVYFQNTILRKGREALAYCLANQIGEQFNFYISHMVFGSGGTVDGTPKIIGSERDGLFAPQISKPVIVSVPIDTIAQIIFTSVLKFDEANGFAINEMGLRMANGHLYSMATFADVNKTNIMQMTWNWSVTMI